MRKVVERTVFPLIRQDAAIDVLREAVALLQDEMDSGEAEEAALAA
jgi:hypothetical protein